MFICFNLFFRPLPDAIESFYCCNMMTTSSICILICFSTAFMHTEMNECTIIFFEGKNHTHTSSWTSNHHWLMLLFSLPPSFYARTHKMKTSVEIKYNRLCITCTSVRVFLIFCNFPSINKQEFMVQCDWGCVAWIDKNGILFECKFVCAFQPTF